MICFIVAAVALVTILVLTVMTVIIGNVYLKHDKIKTVEKK